MTTTSRRMIAALAAVVALLAAVPACAGVGRPKLVIGYQDNGFPKMVEASGVLDDAKYDVEWAILSGPAANLSALYSKKIDVGHMGDTSLIVEQGNAERRWTRDDAPLRIVAGWRNTPDPKYPNIVTAVRTSAGIDRPAQLKGRSWAYNYGGYNHAQYLASLAKAKLTEKDVEPVKFADGNTAAAAFNSGRTDVYSGAPGAIIDSLDSGKAKILYTEQDTGIPALGVWTARSDVLEDKEKDAALADFFTRMAKYWDWHARHPDQVKQILKDVLKQSDRRAEFELHARLGRFRKLDGGLVAKEQKVADLLYDGKAIKRKVDVSVEYDDRYNDDQQAIEVTR